MSDPVSFMRSTCLSRQFRCFKLFSYCTIASLITLECVQKMANLVSFLSPNNQFQYFEVCNDVIKQFNTFS